METTPKLHRKTEKAEVGYDFESCINAIRRGGQPLPESTRNFFEPRLGLDFGSIRVHNDAKAAELAAEVKARAFTVGSDIVFGAGEYSPATDSGKKLLAHELTHAIQQSSDQTRADIDRRTGLRGLSPVTQPVIARQAAPAMVPPVEAPPMEIPYEPPANDNAEPGAFPEQSTGPRYAPSPYDDSLEAAMARANIRDYAERQRIQQERPVATLDRGGPPPNFITEHGMRRFDWAGGPGGGGSIMVRNRQFHVLDAIENAVGQVNNEEQLQDVLDHYVPDVALLNRVITSPRRSLPYLQPGIRIYPLIQDEPVYFEGFDPGARARLQVFETAARRRAQTVPALAQSRLIPRTRRRGGCRLEPISPMGDDPLSALYCHFATGSPYSYKITIESAAGGGLTRRWAEIDALRGNTWYECKCGYEALLTGAARGQGVARAKLDQLDHQVLNHVDIARTCGLEYRYIVSNETVANILRQRWFGNVQIDVVPFEPCD